MSWQQQQHPGDTTSSSNGAGGAAPAEGSSGNTTTASSGDQNYQQQQQQQQAGRGASTGGTTTATTTTTNTGATSSSSMEIDAQQLRHWASPEELLSIKNLLGDLRLRHNAEMQNLTAAYEQARRDNELLRRDAQAFQRLKDAYMASESDFQRMKQERASWHEEREMMALKLEQASIELTRVKQQQQQQQRGASASSTGSSAGGSGATTTTSTTLSLNGMGASVSDAKFILALAESEHRRECEARELGMRLDFQQLTHDMSRQRMQQRASAAEAELRVTKEKLQQARDRAQQLQRMCDDEKVRFAELQAASGRAIGEAESKARLAAEARQAAERALKDEKLDADEEIAALTEQHKAKVDELLRENSAQCASLTASLNRAVATAAKADDVFAREREQLLQELRDVNEALRMERARADNAAQQQSQRLQVVTSERDELQGLLHEAQGECGKLRTRLDVCGETIAALRGEIDELHAAAARNHGAESALAIKDRGIKQLQTVAQALEQRAASAEGQVKTLATALERERCQALTALELLQRQREEREAETAAAHRREVERLERKYRDTKIRLKQLIAWREANEPPRANPLVSAAAADAGEGDAVRKRDALETMREQYEAAAALVRGLG